MAELLVGQVGSTRRKPGLDATCVDQPALAPLKQAVHRQGADLKIIPRHILSRYKMEVNADPDAIEPVRI
jgi:hypothetical protein